MKNLRNYGRFSKNITVSKTKIANPEKNATDPKENVTDPKKNMIDQNAVEQFCFKGLKPPNAQLEF